MSQFEKKPGPPNGLAPGIPVLARSSGKGIRFGTAPGLPAPQHPAAPGRVAVGAQETAAIDQQMARYLGATAKALMRDVDARRANYDEFLSGLAARAEGDSQRDRFLAALKRSLTRRY